MGQPTPPGDSPLYDGLGSEWNDIISGFPEDQRAILAPKLKERISGYETQLEAVKPWQEFSKGGITPEHARTAVDVYSIIENNPRQVYDTLAQHLNITPAQAKEVVQELENDTTGNPEIAALKQQVETLAQIALAQRQQESQSVQQAAADKEIENELSALGKKYGDVDEEEIVMRMLQKNLTAEQAYQEYTNKVSELRKTRPAPYIMGQGGTIPAKQIDVTKLDNKATKNLVAQMLDHANAEARK